MAQPVETLRWRTDRLDLIDQRALPQRVEYLSYTTAAEVAAAIRDMVVRGAPAIGCAGHSTPRAGFHPSRSPPIWPQKRRRSIARTWKRIARSAGTGPP